MLVQIFGLTAHCNIDFMGKNLIDKVGCLVQVCWLFVFFRNYRKLSELKKKLSDLAFLYYFVVMYKIQSVQLFRKEAYLQS